MNLPTAFVFQLSALVIFVGLARIISQAGLAYCRAPVAPAVFTVNTLGSASVGAPGLTALALNFPWSADIRTFVMASAATGLKLAEGGPAWSIGACSGPLPRPLSSLWSAPSPQSSTSRTPMGAST